MTNLQAIGVAILCTLAFIVIIKILVNILGAKEWEFF